jgi:cbb3-type cytochrome oxidase subunit 3
LLIYINNYWYLSKLHDLGTILINFKRYKVNSLILVYNKINRINTKFMTTKKIFKGLYSNYSIQQWLIISLLLLFVVGVLYYFNDVRKKLEERETQYAKLYAQALKFLIEKDPDSDCDYGYVQDVFAANKSIPSITVINGSPSAIEHIPELEDESRKWAPKEKEAFLLKKIAQMKEEHEPLEFKIENDIGYVYYSNSTIVKTLKYFPHVLVLTFLLFGGIAFIAYASSRRAEQNRVWVGLAKETAHQLGTPISGLIGWIEVLKLNPSFDQTLGDEMLKDINRLEVITNRFSNIGSVPSMKEEDLSELLESTTEYLKKRISTKIKWTFENQLSKPAIRRKPL